MQGALGAARVARTAPILADLDEKRMKLIVTRYVARESSFNLGAQFLVGHVVGDEAVAGENAFRVGVDDEDFFVARVEKDRVGGLGADAVNSEKFFAEFESGSFKHSREGTGVFGAKEAHEGFQFFRFLTKVAGRANQRSEPGEGNAFESERSEKAFAAEVGDGAFDVRPRGVLGEDGADDDFEGRARGPPILRAKMFEEDLVIQRDSFRLSAYVT